MSQTDPRLAMLYDTDNPDGPDHDYFRALADRVDAQTIVDLGCGTGILTTTLTGLQRTVIGIDPDDGMLAIARRRQGTELVRWVTGDSRMIGAANADLVLMTGNVAQHIGPDDWPRTLSDIAAGLRPGGVVSFESRNPDAEAWRSWTESNTRGTRDTDHGPLTEWLETTDPDDNGTVTLIAHNVWDNTGEEIVVRLPLTFRSAAQITTDLDQAGLTVTSLCGGWQGEAVNERSPLLVFEATKR